jgi:hypothetical protein
MITVVAIIVLLLLIAFATLYMIDSKPSFAASDSFEGGGPE